MKLTIKVRLAALWGVALLALSVMGVIVLAVHEQMESGAQESHSRADDMVLVTELNQDLLRLTLVAMDSIIDRGEGVIEAERQQLINDLAGRMSDLARRVQAVADTKEERQALAHLPEDTQALVSLVSVDLKGAIEARAADGVFGHLDDVIDEASDKIEKPLAFVSQSLRSEMENAWKEQENRAATALRGGLVTWSVAFLVLSGLSLMIGRTILRPLGALTRTMQSMAGGRLDVTVPEQERQDEVGAMAQAVEVFRDGLAQARQAQAERAAADAQSEQNRREQLAALAKRFEGTVKGVVQTVGLSASHMKETAQSLSDSSDVSGQTVTTLTSQTRQTAANVEAVATAAEELSASISEIARQVAQSSARAGAASEEAHGVDLLVQDLSASARKIGDVVGLISTIASQTNLLALNATIEAARAGEAGKGFAVVAHEVKALANQTAHATAEITVQVGAVQNATQGVVAAITGIGGTIEAISAITASIASAVEQQGAATAEIARNIGEAANGTGSVSANVDNMASVVGQVASGAGDVLSAADELAGNARTLEVQVDDFLAQVRQG